MTHWTIVAVAIGNPHNNRTISDWGHLEGVRPYIRGLMQGLANRDHAIGSDYLIDYRECSADDLETGDAFTVQSGSSSDVVIFGMSTTVVRAAQRFTTTIPIVGIVSDPNAEGFGGARNICGVSARRSQTAGECFQRFLTTVPSLNEVYVLHKEGYGPSEVALGQVKARAPANVTVIPVNIATAADISRELGKLTKRSADHPAHIGIHVLPVDVSLGAAPAVIGFAHDLNVPTFFPITDWVRHETPSALGGYGVPQYTCGKLLAERVDYVRERGVPLPRPRFTDAPDDAFEWWASAAAAHDLGIRLGPGIPQV